MQFHMKSLDALSLIEMDQFLSGGRKITVVIEDTEENYNHMPRY